MWLTTIHLGAEYDDRVRDALTRALRRAGAARLRHRTYVAGGQVETWWYRVGPRLLRIHAETWMGLKIQGPTRLVERIADDVRALLAGSGP